MIFEILLASAIFTALIMLLAVIVLVARSVLLEKASARLTINSERIILVDVGDKLLSALDFCDIRLPRSCGGVGTCGLCRVQVSGTDSSDAVSPIERAELGDSQVAQGFRLACQTVVRGDLSIIVPPDLLGAKIWQCTVREAHFLSPLIKEIVLDLPGEECLDGAAGCYALLTVPAFSLSYQNIEVTPEYESAWEHMGLRQLAVDNTVEQFRAYSLVNRPDQRDTLVLNIRLALPPTASPDAAPGVVSSYLFNLKAGDNVQASGPYGNFFVQESCSEMIFIGGGVGMAPLYAHVYDQLERVKTTRKISYWYGARGLSDLYYSDEMERLAQDYENFSWNVVLSDPAPDEVWTGERGFVHEAIYEKYLLGHPNPQDCEYYLCGPPLMIEAVHSILNKLGVPPETIFFDDFGD